jgi:GNAT superfamily N-acetyltransferase
MEPFDILHDERARECAAVALSAFSSSLSRLYPELAPAIARLKRFGRRRRNRLVASVGETIVGFVDWHDATIDWLLVHAQHQGRGIGAALLAAAERRIGRGVGVLCASRNDRALAFYLRAGYRIARSGVMGRMFGVSIENYWLEKDGGKRAGR